MGREEIVRLAKESGVWDEVGFPKCVINLIELAFAHEREACINIIETYRIPVGNSAAGEMACEWTYDALHEIRDEIRARGEVVEVA